MLLLARLELETRPYHAGAEQPWLGLLARDLTRGRYAAQLARTYGFEVALEAAFAHTPLLSSVVPSPSRARLLTRDLFALDYGALGRLPRTSLAPFASLADACGWLYAVERTARMYPMIAGHVIARFPQLAEACTYLDAGCDGQRWRQLGAAFDHVAYVPRVANQVIAAAHDAFRALAAWYAPDNWALRAGA